MTVDTEDAECIRDKLERLTRGVAKMVNEKDFDFKSASSQEVLEVSSTITEHLGRASVFMVLLLTGTLGIRLQIYTEFKWRREGGQWKCYWVNGGQGMPEPNLGPTR
ncbi:hypothetical protein PRZ48_010682 [Zasmidium cellare]|uniref:DUF4440 domain-containing protein n=1 Tax=Zasmidium cellare TaxID=395010 RepID=A0ABR0E9X6_ZASCE|nr:hypothetical protein PRZ48_010682 [Zasmidium cellare]